MAQYFGLEDDDVVVEDIPVYLAGSNDDIQGDLYLLQFPLREKGRPYGDNDGMMPLGSVQWKNQLKVLEMSYPLLREGESTNYDPDAMFKMDELRLRSRGNPGLATPTNYGIGVMTETVDPVTNMVQKRYVIRPVKGVMQMYPRFDHVDALVQREQQLDMDIEEEEEMKRKANEVKTVISKARKIKQNEAPDRPSYARSQREFARDPWINLEINAPGEEEEDRKPIKWEATREELSAQIPFPLSRYEYLDYLAPIALDDVDSTVQSK
jgi:hypothetical protein